LNGLLVDLWTTQVLFLDGAPLFAAAKTFTFEISGSDKKKKASLQSAHILYTCVITVLGAFIFH